MYPVKYAVSIPARLVNNAADNAKTRSQLIDDNRRLTESNQLLQVHTQRYAALKRENERLRALLNSSAELKQEIVMADVLAVETNPNSRQIVVNKGAIHGIFVGQPMLDAHGVVGQIAHVSPFSSSALLITDPRHALPVMINRNGLRGIAYGNDSDDRLALSFVSSNADVREGDMVVTSGLGQRFPSGYPVGRVATVEVEAGEPFALISVVPSAQVGHAREVMLLAPQTPPSYGAETVGAVAP